MITLIAGILRLDGKPPDPGRVARMIDAMLGHGLPASRSFVQDGRIAVGAATAVPIASTTPPEPHILNADGTLMLADACFYGLDFDPLQALAAMLPNIDQAAGDRLNGDFAFAHWNGTRLTLGRDHFGVRPLHFTIIPEYAAFASLPQGLLQTGLAKRTLDAETLTTYPITAMPVQPQTFFHGVQSVPAAHTVRIDLRGLARMRRYWRLPLGRLLRADAPPENMSREVRMLMDQAVQRRLPADKAVASHLSGGLDSGAVAALAAMALGDDTRLPAFCLAERRDDPDLNVIDELPYAEAIAQKAGNIDLRTVPPADPITLLRDTNADLFLSVHPEEPEEAILRQAASLGVSTILSGWGGDEVTTWRGHGDLAELFWNAQWMPMIRAIKAQSEKSGRSGFGIFRKAVLSESLPNFMRELVRSRHRQPDTHWHDKIATMVPAANRWALDAVPDREYGADSRVQRRGGLEHWSLAGRLEAFAQRGARHGIRYAFPMLDLDLLRFAIRIPAVLLKADGINRAVFRQAMQGILPDEVRLNDRKLTPFPAETLRYAKRKQQLIEAVQQMRSDPLVCRFVDLEGLIQSIESIRDPDEVRSWMNEAAKTGEQVMQHEIYHIFALRLAWYLHHHATDAR